MQIRFLGTGPSSPIPRIYCLCDTCRDARKKGSHSKRLRSSMLLTARGKHILFDAGPDVLQQLERARTYCVDAVFFTHAHNDAAGGFFDLNDLLLQQKHQATVYVEAGTWRRLRQNLGHTKPWLKICLIKPNQKLNIFGTRIVPFRVEHSVTPGFPTLGHRIDDRLIYASDVKKVPRESERYFKSITHLIFDGCTWLDQHLPSHFNIVETIKLAQKFGIKNLYPTQISHRYPPFVIAQKEIEKYLRQNKIPVKVRLAYDEMEITLPS